MNPAHLFVLGVTHRTLSLGGREAFALTAEDATALAKTIAHLPGIEESVLLSTCNRLQVCGVAADERALESVAAAFGRFRPAAAGQFRQHQVISRGRDALRHLLEIAVGLDSQLLGETEIFGQMKKAYATAQGRGATGPVLNRVFQKTFQAAKRARAQAGIAEGAVSVANIAVDIATNVFGSLARTRVLLVGAGEIGAKCGRAFASRGAASLTVSSRCPERTAGVAGELAADSIPFPQLGASLAGFDIVVCATSAPAPIIVREAVTEARRQRGERPILFVDLSMPRNVEPSVASLDGAFVFNLDDLARISDENRAARGRELDRCADFLSLRAAEMWSQVSRLLETRGTGSNEETESAEEFSGLLRSA